MESMPIGNEVEVQTDLHHIRELHFGDGAIHGRPPVPIAGSIQDKIGRLSGLKFLGS
jgi:hypothetical protein